MAILCRHLLMSNAIGAAATQAGLLPTVWTCRGCARRRQNIVAASETAQSISSTMRRSSQQRSTSSWWCRLVIVSTLLGCQLKLFRGASFLSNVVLVSKHVFWAVRLACQAKDKIRMFAAWESCEYMSHVTNPCAQSSALPNRDYHGIAEFVPDGVLDADALALH